MQNYFISLKIIKLCHQETSTEGLISQNFLLK